MEEVAYRERRFWALQLASLGLITASLHSSPALGWARSCFPCMPHWAELMGNGGHSAVMH